MKTIEKTKSQAKGYNSSQSKMKKIIKSIKRFFTFENHASNMDWRFFTVVLFFILSSPSTQAQSVKKDAQGNYIAMRTLKDTTLKATGHTYTDTKGKVYPVYISKNGKLFVIRTSSKGNLYKQYLKVQE